MHVIAVVVAALAGAYIAISGILKLREGWAVSAATIGAYKLLGPIQVKALALVLAPVEIAAGVLLATGLAPLSGGLTVIALLVVYSIAIASALRRGLATSCGCHGTLSKKEVSPALIARNAVLALLVAFATIVLVPTHAVYPSLVWTAAGVAAAGLVAANVALSRGHGGSELQEQRESEVHVEIP